MAQSRKSRHSEMVRNRILALMAVAIVVLVAVIVITNPKQKKLPTVTTPSSSVSQNPSSVAMPSSSADEATSSSKPANSEPALPYYEADMPMLVNPTNKIPDSFKPDVAVIGDGCSYSYDKNATIAYKAMADKAKSEGISLWVLSAYRSTEKQTTNFNAKVKEYEGLGYTAEQAYAATAKIIALPGYSEHSIGLALDLNSLETDFEKTEEFKWLIKNCADFGFILRYPKDKESVTEISYEPWHYRYVGSNHAQIIMQKGICLEEYLSGDY